MEQENNDTTVCYVTCEFQGNKYHLCKKHDNYELVHVEKVKNYSDFHMLYFKSFKDLFTFLYRHDYKTPFTQKEDYDFKIIKVIRSFTDNIYLYDSTEDIFLQDIKNKHKIIIFNNCNVIVTRIFGKTKYECVTNTIEWIKKMSSDLYGFNRDELFDMLMFNKEHIHLSDKYIINPIITIG